MSVSNAVLEPSWIMPPSLPLLADTVGSVLGLVEGAGYTSRVSSQPSPSHLPASVPDSEILPSPGWRTVVHNDPINLMSYVEWVFQSYFGMARDRAKQLMLQVHEDGRAEVSRGQREQMEADAQAMHRYGLWATIEEEK